MGGNQRVGSLQDQSQLPFLRVGGGKLETVGVDLAQGEPCQAGKLHFMRGQNDPVWQETVPIGLLAQDVERIRIHHQW